MSSQLNDVVLLTGLLLSQQQQLFLSSTLITLFAPHLHHLCLQPGFLFLPTELAILTLVLLRQSS